MGRPTASVPVGTGSFLPPGGNRLCVDDEPMIISRFRGHLNDVYIIYNDVYLAMIGQQYDLCLSLFVGATVPTSSRVQAPQSIKVLRFELPSTSKYTSIGFKYNDFKQFNNASIYTLAVWDWISCPGC